MATIRKIDNRYKITVSLGYDENHKQIRKSIMFTPSETAPTKVKKEVQTFATSFEKKVKNGEYYDGENMTFREFAKKWEKDYAKDNISESTLDGYKQILESRVYGEIGSLRLSKIKAPHLQRIYNKMKEDGLSATTIKKTHATISGIFKIAYKWNLIFENPCSRVSLPKCESKNEVSSFDVAQTETFLKALTLPYKHTVKAHDYYTATGEKKHVNEYTETHYIPLQFIVYFNIAIFSGCRRGEMISLTWKDINFKENTISITKSTAKTANHGQVIKTPKTKAGYRLLTLPQSCFDLLKRWKKEQRELLASLGDYWKGQRDFAFNDNFVFIQNNGSQMSLDTPSHKLKEIIQAYNKQYSGNLPVIRLHDLRHTNATLLISQNTDVRTVSARLGHARSSITLDIYTHALRANDEKASACLENLLQAAK